MTLHFNAVGPIDTNSDRKIDQHTRLRSQAPWDTEHHGHKTTSLDLLPCSSRTRNSKLKSLSSPPVAHQRHNSQAGLRPLPNMDGLQTSCFRTITLPSLLLLRPLPSRLLLTLLIAKHLPSTLQRVEYLLPIIRIDVPAEVCRMSNLANPLLLPFMRLTVESVAEQTQRDTAHLRNGFSLSHALADVAIWV